ncbi:TonB-dependent receptor plug domain-containing protein [Pontibacter rugosus]
MKQTLPFCLKRNCFGILTLGCALLSLTATAQSAAPDTLQTGYGAKPAAEITESIRQLPSDQLNQGLVTSLEQLLQGQIAGLRVMPSGGAPGAGATMQLRLGAAVFGNSAPLLVLDGVPLANSSASERISAFAFINPDDIASVALLKDAAATAIYGSRAANGVLLVTTKQGVPDKKIKLTYTTTAGISVLRKKADVLSADEFRSLVRKEFPDQVGLLGNENTDWQDVIYRKAFSHDQNVSVSGTVGSTVPYRVSFGHLNQKGILKSTQHRRNSLAVSVNPSLLQEHLKLNVSVRKVDQKVDFAAPNAITAALLFDPTQPVYQENNYGNYFTYLDTEGKAIESVSSNPLSLLEQRRDVDETSTLFGQAHLQYKFHFFPALSLHLRYAFQNQDSEYGNYQPMNMISSGSYSGRGEEHVGAIDQDLKESFIVLDQPLESLQSKLRLTAGASMKKLTTYSENRLLNTLNGEQMEGNHIYYKSRIESVNLYSQADFIFKNRYSINASIVNEQDSHIVKQKSITGALGAAWDIAKEPVLEANKTISSLKLYANYSNFNKTGFYKNLQFMQIQQPDHSVVKWNAGVAWGVAEDRLYGDINYFNTNVSNFALATPEANKIAYSSSFMEGGAIRSSGVEGSLRYEAVRQADLKWSFGVNVSYAQSEVVKLPYGSVYYPYDAGYLGSNVLSLGESPAAFYLLKQLYDAAGKPLEREYEPNYEMRTSYHILGKASRILHLG